MFSGEEPLLEILGYDVPDGEYTSLFSGVPSSSMGIYSVSVPPSSYYLINFKLQNCYLVNP
jgi:hypothetical protein